MEDFHRRAIETHILSNRTHKFRRTVIVLSLVLIGLHVFAGDLNLLKLPVTNAFKNTARGQDLLRITLWLTLGYNAVVYFKDARSEFTVWKLDALKGGSSQNHGFPLVRMFFGRWHFIPLLRSLLEPRPLNKTGLRAVWKFKIHDNAGDAVWTAEFPPNESGKPPQGHRYWLRRFEYLLLRGKIRDFWLFEIGVPVVVIAFAVMLPLRPELSKNMRDRILLFTPTTTFHSPLQQTPT